MPLAMILGTCPEQLLVHLAAHTTYGTEVEVWSATKLIAIVCGRAFRFQLQVVIPLSQHFRGNQHLVHAFVFVKCI